MKSDDDALLPCRAIVCARIRTRSRVPSSVGVAEPEQYSVTGSCGSRAEAADDSDRRSASVQAEGARWQREGLSLLDWQASGLIAALDTM
jgi:hypothetical protein